MKREVWNLEAIQETIFYTILNIFLNSAAHNF